MKFIKIVIAIFILVIASLIIRNNFTNKNLPVHIFKHNNYVALSKGDVFTLRLDILGSKNSKPTKDIAETPHS